MAHALHVYQALWAMDKLSSPEASTAEKFDRVCAAGFDGMAIDLGALTMAEAEATVPHFSRTGLRGGLTAFPTSVEALRPALALAHRIAAPYVVVIGQEMPVALGEMIPVIEGWLRVAEQERMPIQFETHRNCITNDLYTTVQLLDAIPAMRLAADLSHYVVSGARSPHRAHSLPLRFLSGAGGRPGPNPIAAPLPAECEVGDPVPPLVARGL
jgi:sugar phosphate isomerase/epimerase